MADAFATVNISGAIFATCENGAVLGDNTGFIYYLSNSKFDVGDIVSLRATIMPSGAMNILINGSDETIHGKDGIISFPECIPADGIFMNNWIENPRWVYVEVFGNMNKSGSNYYVNVEETNCVASIVSPSSSLLENLPDNCRVKVKGFAVYNSGDKYMNIVVTDVVDCTISNTIETAYSISECIDLIDAGKGLETKVYIKGIVSNPNKNQFVDLIYGNATFYISDDGSTNSPQFLIIRGYDFGGNKFREDKFKLGDEVIFYGYLTKYLSTYETQIGAELVLHNGYDISQNQLSCSKPSIEYKNGQLYFSCPTPNAEFHYSIIPCASDDITTKLPMVTFTPHYKVTCYATAPNRSQSETVFIIIPIPMGLTGDMNADGKLSISDVTKLVDAVANGEYKVDYK